MTDPIQTHEIRPPIPDRRWDWTAYRDPELRAGYGSTEAAAVLDLLTLEYEEDEDHLWTDDERRLFAPPDDAER